MMIVRYTALTGWDFLAILFIFIIVAWIIAIFIHVKTKGLKL
jgi:hypothetical protein